MKSPPKLSKEIKKIITELKTNYVIQELFDKYGVNIDEFDYIPICFAELDVSARTDHGIIYLNIDLLDNIENVSHYLAHEVTHVLQQTTGDGPTSGSTEETYLDNPAEIEGFQVQTEFISETEGDEVAEDYIENVLLHHEVDGKEKNKRKKQLLQLASELLKSKIA